MSYLNGLDKCYDGEKQDDFLQKKQVAHIKMKKFQFIWVSSAKKSCD